MEYTGDRTYDRVLTGTLGMTSLMLSLAKYQAKAEYGKYGGRGSGVSLDPKLGWWLMELPATLSFLTFFWRGRSAKVRAEREERDLDKKKRGPSGWTPKVLFLVWCLHYGNRGWFFPLNIRVAKGTKQSFALYNSLIGALFLAAHGYLNGRMFSELGTKYTDAWLRDPRFLIGFLVWASGYAVTVHSESIMRNLRPADGIVSAADRYKIPTGGMYEYVTNAPYLGELTAWLGFNIMTWSPSTLPALFISLANLVPRALEQHKWYLRKFPDYPKNRKALVPFLL
jgi:3-oxo-5-alpha-steroid 4-dehydrogenase 1